MKLDQIHEMWSLDSQIDPSELGAEAIKIPLLHGRYFKVLSEERMKLRQLEATMKQLRIEKFEFYTQGPTEETHAKGWRLPPIGKILKADVNNYIESDKDIIKLSLQIGIQLEKVDLLQEIVRAINNRGYHLKVALDWEKFKSGTG